MLNKEAKKVYCFYYFTDKSTDFEKKSADFFMLKLSIKTIKDSIENKCGDKLELELTSLFQSKQYYRKDENFEKAIYLLLLVILL